MDPLSVAASIVGILAATAKVIEIVQPYVSDVLHASDVAKTVYSEVIRVRIILEPLKDLLQEVADPSSSAAACASFIRVDYLRIIFTDGVLLFSELQTLVEPMKSSDDEELRLSHRWRWSAKKTAIFESLQRMRHFLVSLSALMNILQCRSDVAALKVQKTLESQISTLVESNRSLVERLKHLEHYSYGEWTNNALADIPEPIASSSDQLKLGRNIRQSLDVSEAHKKALYEDSDKFSTTSQASRFSSLSALRFHSHLASSRVYRRVTRTESVMSFSTSALGSKAWSVFSGISLSEVSVVSAIALPLISSDIDHSNHYEFGRIVVAESAKDPFLCSSLHIECIEFIRNIEIWSIQSIAPLYGFDLKKVLQRGFEGGNDPLEIVNRILQDPKFAMIFESSLAPASNSRAYSMEDVLPIIAKQCYRGQGISERERIVIMFETWRQDIWKIRPVIRTMNRALCRHQETLGIPNSTVTTEAMEQAAKMITSPNKGVKIFGQFLMDERLYVNQLERFLDLLFVIQQVEKFAYISDISLSLEKVWKTATSILYKLDGFVWVEDVFSAAELLDGLMVRHYDRNYSTYRTYAACDKAWVQEQFGDIRDYVLSHYIDMRDIVETEYVFLQYLLLPSSRWARFLTFVNRIANIVRLHGDFHRDQDRVRRLYERLQRWPTIN